TPSSIVHRPSSRESATKLQAANYLLPVCLAAMDGCWVFVAAWLFGALALPQGGRLAVPPPVLAGLELAAWWLASTLLDRTRLAPPAAQTLSGAVGVIVSLAVVAAAHGPAGG